MRIWCKKINLLSILMFQNLFFLSSMSLFIVLILSNAVLTLILMLLPIIILMKSFLIHSTEREKIPIIESSIMTCDILSEIIPLSEGVKHFANLTFIQYNCYWDLKSCIAWFYLEPNVWHLLFFENALFCYVSRSFTIEDTRLLITWNKQILPKI